MRSRPSAVLSALVLMACLAAPASGQEKPSLEEILDSGRLEDIEGCWECVAGLVNSKTKEPLAMAFCFDADGEGERTVKEKFGDTCRGSARAVLQEDGVLAVEAGPAQCFRTDASYVAQRIECRNASGGPECQGSEERKNGSPSKWKAVFERE